MVKNKKLLGILIGSTTLLVVVGSAIAAQNYFNKQKKVDFGAESLQSNSLNDTDKTNQQSQNQQSLNNNLSASNSAATSLGQINPSQKSANSAVNGTNNSSSAQEIDPATFAQYEKYKNSSDALFGDYKVGTGAAIGANQKAAVYYKGWLTNGQLFDQSRAGSDGKLQPFVFTIGAHAVIPGWEQGLVGMKVGGMRLLIIPPSLGYGSSGQGSIPPNSVLVFLVELLAIQ